MTCGARFNLVRVDDLETTEGLDAEAGQTVYTQQDEVELVTPNGDCSVMPSAFGWTQRDVVYEYTDGSVGISKRRRRHRIELAVDYIGDETRGRIEEWMRDRALVWFSPGYGRYTDFAVRPLWGYSNYYPDGTTTHKDLTGKYTVTSSSGTGVENYVWDKWRRVMRGTFPNYANEARRVIPTPGGAGICCERAKNNRFRPAFPASATEGPTESGWTKGGSDSADLTFTLVADAFGHDDMPDALRVQASYGASKDRYVICSDQFDGDGGDFAFTGSSQASVSIWLKGRFPDSATLDFVGYNTSDSISLDAYDTSEWTKFALIATSSNWATTTPYVRINLDSDADGDSADFMIGPTVVDYTDGSPSQPDPEYCDGAGSGSWLYVSSYTFPANGSEICSFWWPEGAVLGDFHYIIGASQVPGRLGVSGLSTAIWGRTAANSISSSITPVEGAINTLAAVWSSGGDHRLYHNGSLVDTGTTSERENTIAAASCTLYLGYTGSRAAWPLVPLTARIDRRAYSASEIAQIDASLRDPVANHMAVQARGRKYRIVQAPSTARNQQGGTVWIGSLVLEEYEYDTNLADITTEEP